MRRLARRAIPRFAFDYVDGAALGEVGAARNRAAFDAVRLAPRVMTGNDVRDSRTTLLGKNYTAPFGIAPLGMCNIFAPGTDAALARAAHAAGISYALSTAGTTSIEDIAAVAPESWFQLYVGRDQHVVDDLIRRADAAGCSALIVTVDVPAPGKRVRDLVNGFSLPLKPGPRMAWDVVTHPAWAWRMAMGGGPRFANLETYAPPGSGAHSLAKFMASQASARMDWDLLSQIRERWKRPLILKGLLRPEDAAKAVSLGVDAIGVSNHGARQLDAAPAPLEALPAIRATLPNTPIILDGGVRSGEDIARAIIMGADHVMLGRPFLYAAGGLGLERGPELLINMLKDEFDRTLAQLGCASVKDLNSGLIFRPRGS